jgi:DNA-binding YbaB/EbfC family protein
MDIQKVMQQAQQMQQMQERLQKQMTDMRVDASAGGGVVFVVVNGNKQVLSVTIDPAIVSKDDIEMLQDLIVAAIADAHRKVDEALASTMQGIMGGLGLPRLS